MERDSKEPSDKGRRIVCAFCIFSESMNKWRILQQYWEVVKLLLDEYPFWMPMPELPEMLDRINKGLRT